MYADGRIWVLFFVNDHVLSRMYSYNTSVDLDSCRSGAGAPHGTVQQTLTTFFFADRMEEYLGFACLGFYGMYRPKFETLSCMDSNTKKMSCLVSVAVAHVLASMLLWYNVRRRAVRWYNSEVKLPAQNTAIQLVRLNAINLMLKLNVKVEMFSFAPL